MTLFAILASIGAIVLWAILQDSAEQRDADALFLSPSADSQSRTANETVDLDALARSLGGKPVDGPPSDSLGRTGQQGQYSSSDIDHTVANSQELRACEPGTTADALPANGAVWRYDQSAPLAPFEVKVKGAEQYLVKLERGGVTAAMMLVRAASASEILVPLGDYVLKYATGSGEYWCGVEATFPFGRQTSFHKADEIFSFRKESDQYSGHTVELFLQENGNLSTSALSPRAW